MPDPDKTITNPTDTVTLHCRVIPRARFTGWGGERSGRMVIRLRAAPVAGKANTALKKFIAGEFGTPVSSVIIERGMSSREKTLKIVAPRRIPEQPRNSPGLSRDTASSA